MASMSDSAIRLVGHKLILRGFVDTDENGACLRLTSVGHAVHDLWTPQPPGDPRLPP